jgi:predicted Zn-dependent protease
LRFTIIPVACRIDFERRKQMPLIAMLLLSLPLYSADPRIGNAEAIVSAAPADVAKRLDLVHLLLERYRYTFDAAIAGNLRNQLDVILRQSPGNFLGKKYQAFFALLNEDFESTRKLAAPLNRKAPDDIDLYGYLVDAESAFGNYAAAEHHANWMLRLRPENRQAMRRAAELRVVFGDLEGAILMINDLYRFTPKTETLERAWAFGRLAHLTKDGNPERAEKLARQSLTLEPDCFEGATALATILAASGRHTEAVEVWKPLAARTGRASVHYALGRSLRDAGRLAEAEAAFVQSDRLATNRLSDTLARIDYLLAVKGDAAEAVRLAESHAAYRNVQSLTSFARAFAAAGQTARSRDLVAAALSQGAKDPQLLAIAHRLGVK